MAIRDFAERTVLVTGAASGIGRETALAFARAGAKLVVCDLNERGIEETAQAIRGLGRPVLARAVDVASPTAMAEFAAAVHREHEAVDVLVNNAGVGLGGGLPRHHPRRLGLDPRHQSAWASCMGVISFSRPWLPAARAGTW